MSGLVQTLLTQSTQAFFGNEYLRDFQHASKVFRPNNYAYSPKFKFLFHVYFDINTDISNNIANWPKDGDFGLAVKTVQLPKYSFELATLNQYNRKRVVQTKIKYDPVNITLHDDNANLIRQLWYSYYAYYYNDPNYPSNVVSTTTSSTSNVDLNKRNIYDKDISNLTNWGYTGEPLVKSSNTSTAVAGDGVKVPFFKSIRIYGFNQHNFVMYQLINPTIESFTHDTYNYAEGNGTMEHQMAIQYETVKYYDGAVDGKRPQDKIPGFGDAAHYDTTISPIAIPGSNSTILGQGGLVSAVGGFIDDVASGNFAGAAKIAGTTVQTFKNPQNILNIAKGEALNIAAGAVQNTPNRNNIFNFPTADSTALRNPNSGIGSITATPLFGVPKTPPSPL